MAVLVATPPGAADANSYLTQAEATDILTTRRLNGDAWVRASNSQKDAALMWATRLIDDSFAWFGVPTWEEQALKWPRGDVLDLDDRPVDEDNIPDRVKEATADLALSLLQRDRTAEPALLGLGFSRAQLGSMSVQVDPKMVLALIPSHVIAALRPFGDPVITATGPYAPMRIVDLVRD